MAMFTFNRKGEESYTPEAPVREDGSYEQAAVAAPNVSSKLQQDMVIHGNVESISDIVVSGTIKGNVNCQGCVQAKDAVIEGGVTAKLLNMHGGTIQGDLNIEDTVMIDGIVNGNVTCEEVLLQCNARVTGDIRCAQFCAAFGAMIEGRVSVSGVSRDAKLEESAAQLAECDATDAETAAVED